MRIAPVQSVQANEIEALADPRCMPAFRPLLIAEPKSDVFRHSQMRKQREVLEDEIDGPLIRGCAGDIGPVEENPPACRLLEPGDHSEQGGFAASARSQQREKFATVDVERNAIDRREITESPARVANLNRQGRRLFLLRILWVHR